MSREAPTHIYPRGAKILYADWKPHEKEDHIFFRCGSCDAVFSYEASKLTSSKSLQCDCCETEHYVSMSDAMAIRKKMTAIRGGSP